MSVSNCCLSVFQAVTSDEGTSYYVCNKCKKACDPVRMTNPETTGELGAIARTACSEDDFDHAECGRRGLKCRSCECIITALSSQRTKYEAELARLNQFIQKIADAARGKAEPGYNIQQLDQLPGEISDLWERFGNTYEELEGVKVELRQAGEIIEDLKADNLRICTQKHDLETDLATANEKVARYKAALEKIAKETHSYPPHLCDYRVLFEANKQSAAQALSTEPKP